MKTSLSNRPRQNLELIWVAGISIIGAIVLVFWAQYRGALGSPRNDDWVYLHMADWLASSGQFVVESGSLTNASGQIFLSQPIIWIFGNNIAALQIFVALLGVIGILATWVIVRTFLSVSISILVLLTMVLSPFWATLSLSFMTDIPAFTFQALALMFLLKASGKQGLNWIWIAVSLAFALLAFSIREYAIAAGMTVLLFICLNGLKASRKNFYISLVVGFVWLFVAYGLYQWRSHLNNAVVSPPALSRSDVAGAIVQFTQALIILGIFLWPGLIAVNWLKFFKSMSVKRILGTLVAPLLFVGFCAYLYLRISLTLGNTLTIQGSYPGTLPLGRYPEIMPQWLFQTIEMFGIVGMSLALLLAGAMLTRKDFWTATNLKKFTLAREKTSLLILGIYVLGTLAILGIVVLVTTAPLIDRYLIGIIPFALALCFSATAALDIRINKAFVTSLAMVSLLALLGFVYTDTSLVVDGAKWKMGNQVVQAGFSPETIDAGYEWFGYHQQGLAQGKFVEPIPNWWTTLYEHPNVCVLVGMGNESEFGYDPNSLVSEYSTSNISGTRFKLWAVTSSDRCTN